MSAATGHDDDGAREIARALAAAVLAAVETTAKSDAGPRALAWHAAADVAGLLDLPGLAALLVVCELHADSPPTAVKHVLDRLTRLAHAVRSGGDLKPFLQADRELAALAGQLGEQQWSEPTPDGGAPQPVQSLAELLADMELDDAASLAHAVVTLSVAAGLRAALDWIGAESGGALHVRMHEAALTLGVRVTQASGLGAAGALLALSGGSLLPETDGRWLLRVPLYAKSPAFLLARQGDLSLALPWHAVARLRICDDASRAAMSEPSLTPWVPFARAHGERPTALLALGLSQAWLPLDHIVWRVFAQPEPAEVDRRVPGGREVLRMDDGEEYDVVDVALALRDVPAVPTPPAQPRTRARVAAAPTPGETHHETDVPATSEPLRPAAPEPLPSVAPEPPRPVAPDPLRPVALTALQVRPLALGRSVAGETAASAAPSEKPANAPVKTPESVSPPRQRRALVVDDSLITRMALTRVLERAGYSVECAGRASEMWAALEQGAWSVVFVDVFLPDASGRSHLRALIARQLAAAQRFELVALTRDGSEEQLVAETGISRTLRKPFRPGLAEAMVRELPVPPVGA